MKVLGLFLLCAYSFHVISTLSIPELSDGRKYRNLNQTEVEKLVIRQTEAIKKIVSDKQKSELENSQIDQTETESKINQDSKNSSEDELQNLRSKCEHLEKLIKANNSRFGENERIDKIPNQSVYRNKIPTQVYPVYFQGKRDKNKSSTPKIKGFYVTTDSTETNSHTTPKTVNKDQSNVKYIKLEPVILQKTYLTNGKVVYYWHKSLPSAIHYSSPNSPAEAQKHVSTTPPTTTTTASSSIYSFKSFFPFYPIGNPDLYSATTDSTTTSTTTTTPKPYSDFEDLSTQLKFVVPLPYANSENLTRDPWNFDQFAYYPKPLQPSKVNIQVPYVPTFHVIKAVAVPNKYLQDTNSNPNTDVLGEDNFFSNA